ncbi:hypothetical protein JS532_10000 [Bifidobacterium callimiconis]|uniref:hypothetical protein n=1 Tax=Bifidobacterium callimiconis TaxID=2306973 RepID=UPI001BDCB659|nr:hypothetical protein [Bifidobacterium callimiconis]MBT1177883.1 hypothetical protein [Bifidobacterium callimiconis]
MASLSKKKIFKTSKAESLETVRAFWKTRKSITIIGVLLIAIAEIFIFNMPYWQSINATPQTLNVANIASSGLKPTEKGLIVKDPSQAFVEISESTKIGYIKANFATKATAVPYTTAIKYDGSGDQYYTGSLRNISTTSKYSSYINTGKTSSTVRINFTSPEGTLIPIKNFTVNAKVPFSFNAPRIILLLTLLTMIVFLGPSSELYKVRFSLHKTSHIIAVSLTTLSMMTMITFTWLLSSGRYYWIGTTGAPENHIANFDQYGYLADALLHGHTWLNLPVDANLASMPNPYDIAARSILSGNGSQIFFDHAFYNGHYYSYFGVIPALLFFVPFQFITGTVLHSAYAVIIAALFTSLAFTALALSITRNYFPKASLGNLLSSILILNLGSNILYQAFTPSFYCVPQVTSMMFTAAGLSLWMYAKKKDKTVSPTLIAAGSFCIACNLGCRPQFILSALLAIPLFWDSVFIHRSLFSRKGIIATICSIIPFLIVFIPLGIYNWVRFDSFSNFGSNYNLTGFDMTNSVKPLTALVPLLFYFFFQPGSIIGQFPFVGTTETPVITWSPMEPSIGGLAMIAPFTLILLAMPWSSIWNKSTTVSFPLKEKRKVSSFTILSIVLGIVIAVADARVAGFAWRYISDFAWAICISTIISILCLASDDLENNQEKSHSRILNLFVITTIIFSLIYQFFSMFTSGRYGNMIEISPSHYFYFADWFLFLM